MRIIGFSEISLFCLALGVATFALGTRSDENGNCSSDTWNGIFETDLALYRSKEWENVIDKTVDGNHFGVRRKYVKDGSPAQDWPFMQYNATFKRELLPFLYTATVTQYWRYSSSWVTQATYGNATTVPGFTDHNVQYLEYNSPWPIADISVCQIWCLKTYNSSFFQVSMRTPNNSWCAPIEKTKNVKRAQEWVAKFFEIDASDDVINFRFLNREVNPSITPWIAKIMYGPVFLEQLIAFYHFVNAYSGTPLI